MTDRDPLAGANPVPRDQLEIVPLHEARHELLGEIMSTADPSLASRRNSKRLLPVAAAAVIALLAGGAWFAVGGSGGDDPPPVASSGDGTQRAADPMSASPSADRDPRHVSAKACARFRNPRGMDTGFVVVANRAGQLQSLTIAAARRAHHRSASSKTSATRRFVQTRNGRWVEIDRKQCRYLIKGDPELKLLRRLRFADAGSGVASGRGLVVVRPDHSPGTPDPTPTPAAPSPPSATEAEPPGDLAEPTPAG